MINTFEFNQVIKKQKKSKMIEILDVCFDLDYEVSKMKKFNILHILRIEIANAFEYAYNQGDYDFADIMKDKIVKICI